MRLQTRTALLVEAVYKWNITTSTDKKYIAKEVVDVIRQADLYEALEVHGIYFNESGDIFKDIPRFYEKLFRWLGELDTKQQPDKLWFVEHLIVQAMPEDIKQEYLNNVYGQSGVSVTISCIDADGLIDLDLLFTRLIKEHADLQQALVVLPKTRNVKQLKQYRTEAQEALAITQNALDVIESMITEHEESRADKDGQN